MPAPMMAIRGGVSVDGALVASALSDLPLGDSDELMRCVVWPRYELPTELCGMKCGMVVCLVRLVREFCTTMACGLWQWVVFGQVSLENCHVPSKVHLSILKGF